MSTIVLQKFYRVIEITEEGCPTSLSVGHIVFGKYRWRARFKKGGLKLIKM
jgi:hypothetical protein